MKKQLKGSLKNMLVWCVFFEAVCIWLICLLIAAMSEGRMMMILLGLASLCSIYFALFIQVNAKTFDNRIDRMERKVVRFLKKISVTKKRTTGREQSPKRNFKVYTFVRPE